MSERKKEKERGKEEDKRLVLGRFTAGWLFQIRQVRWFDAEERHRSVGHVVAKGQCPPDEARGGEHSRGGEPRPVTSPRELA